jgi:hypothetical protein
MYLLAPHATTAKPLREEEVRRWILTFSRDPSVASFVRFARANLDAT